MSYLWYFKEWEEHDARVRASHPLCDESPTCPAPDDAHIVGCRNSPATRQRHAWWGLGYVNGRLVKLRGPGAEKGETT